MVIILGSPRAAPRLVKHMKNYGINAVYTSPSLRDINFKKKIRSHKVIHYIGSPTVTLHGILTLLRFKIWKKKVIVSWRGTDVVIANKKIIFRILTRIFQSFIDYNSALAPHLVAELEQIGVKTVVTPIPTFSLYKIRELPSQKKVAVYLPDKFSYQWDWFQGNLIKKIIKEFPDVEFIITANSGKNFSEKNVRCIDWTEKMEEVYAQVQAVIRLPFHDGLSCTILETVSMGRKMIAWNVVFPFCKVAKNYEDVKKYLKEVLENPILDVNNSQYVHKKYEKEKITQDLIAVYNKLEKKNNL